VALDIIAATAYINTNVIDTEDWVDADDDKKQRLLNVADKTLQKRYGNFTIPDNAVYDFAAVLAVAFNDTNKLQQQGVAQFAIKGIAFTFKNTPVKELDAFIPQSTLDIIGDANGVKLSKRRVGRSVR
jgi:hypothetical protein